MIWVRCHIFNTDSPLWYAFPSVISLHLLSTNCLFSCWSGCYPDYAFSYLQVEPACTKREPTFITSINLALNTNLNSFLTKNSPDQLQTMTNRGAQETMQGSWRATNTKPHIFCLRLLLLFLHRLSPSAAICIVYFIVSQHLLLYASCF